MELTGVVGVLMLGIIIFFLFKMIIDSIKFVFLLLLTMMVLVYFFGISFSDITAWIAAQGWLNKIFHSLVSSLLYSLGN